MPTIDDQVVAAEDDGFTEDGVLQDPGDIYTNTNSSVIYSGWDSEMIIVFKEKMFTVLKAERGYEDDISINQGEFNRTNFDSDSLIEAGFFTKEQLEDLKKAAKEKFKLNEEERDRKELARLKRKREPNMK